MRTYIIVLLVCQLIKKYAFLSTYIILCCSELGVNLFSTNPHLHSFYFLFRVNKGQEVFLDLL